MEIVTTIMSHGACLVIGALIGIFTVCLLQANGRDDDCNKTAS